jgi:3-oxoacyl-[acyl-carrier protein] reductase
MIRKTAIIIGASSEIGLETAKNFAKNGYNLALTYNTNEIDKSLFVEDITVKTYPLNLCKNGEIEKFFSEVKKDFKTLDCLVYCAGVAQKRALILDVTNEEIDNLFEVNIKSAIKSVREFAKIVASKQASIVLVGSFDEKIGCSCESVYTATKSAMTGLCKSLSSELGNLGIRINVVAPGFIDTKMNANLSSEDKDEIAAMTPLQRLGKTEDVSNAILFLVGDASSFISGQTLFVDGGLILE